MAKCLKSLVVLFGFYALGSFAALPPLDRETLVEDSTHVVKGEVLDFRKQERYSRNGNWQDVYTARVAIASTSITKGNFCGQTSILVRYRTIHHADGMLGPIGQNVLPKVFEKCHFFLRLNEQDNVYDTLEPNGIQSCVSTW